MRIRITLLPRKNQIDEGCNDELNVTAFFSEIFEIPKSEPYLPIRADSKSTFLNGSSIAITRQNIPRDYALFLNADSEKYRELLIDPEKFVKPFRKFSCVVLAENIDDLLANPPFTFVKQLRNIYRLRTLERYFQKNHAHYVKKKNNF